MVKPGAETSTMRSKVDHIRRTHAKITVKNVQHVKRTVRMLESRNGNVLIEPEQRQSEWP